MVDAELMAVFHGVQNLEEDLLGKIILPNVLTALRDVQEKIPFRTVFKDHVDAIGIVHNLQHRHNVLVCRCQVVQTNFPLLVSNLATFQWGSVGIELAETLDRIANLGVNIDGGVDHTIGTSSKDVRQLELAFKQSTKPFLGP